MPTKPRTPSYRLHKPSGRAVVTLDGKDCYLGPYRSRISREEYDRLIAEWLANGRRLRRATEPVELTVNELILAYWRFAEDYYRKNGKPTVELSMTTLRWSRIAAGAIENASARVGRSAFVSCNRGL